MSDHLLVFLSGTHSADITRSRRGDLSLTYTPAGARLGSTPLTLAMPPSAERYRDRQVSHWLTGLVPERSETRDALARHHGLSGTDPFTLLHAIGLDCAGAVQFCAPGTEEEISRVGHLTPESDSDIEARLNELEMDESTSWTKKFEHWSLAGFQPKFTLRRKGGTWWSAHGAEPTTHIVKPGVRGIRLQALDEHVTLDAARRLGLNCARSDWTEFKAQSAIVVERYDRAQDGAGGLMRLHQEDLHQAIGMGLDKYDAPGHHGVTAADILAALRAWSVSRDDQDRSTREFVDALIYSVVSASTDGHAKNYSLLLERDRVVLAPLYDIASDLPYSHADSTLAMAVGGERRHTHVARTHWEELARSARLDPDYVLGRVERIATDAPEAFSQALSAIDAPQASALRARMEGALVDHTKQVRARAIG